MALRPGKVGRPRTCECGDCIKCKRRDYMREWYANKTLAERRAIIARRDPERVRENDRKRQPNRDPRKQKARWSAANAIRDGRLPRQPCEVCGSPKTDAHHDDYERPLDVRWLCRECHTQYHAALGGAA